MALWVSFVVITIIFAFGVAVQVDFNDPSVPFSQALESTRWERALPGSHLGEYHLIFLGVIAGLLLHTFLWSWRNRLGALAIGFSTPIFAMGPVMLWVAAVSPLMVLNTLIGNVDGEFYGEGTLMIAAIGMWMLVCLVFAIREVVMLRRARKSVLAGRCS
ncbi:MAG: hypothetical protein V4819_14290 [Verrucomicrobiota bacterium]